MNPTIQTFTGREFWPLDPQPEMICIEDIAHHLANICRFTGAVRRFYSVAEHSLLVSLHVDHDAALWGLLHDASEAYLLDMAKPLKTHFPDYVSAEKRLMQAVCKRFHLPPEEPEQVKIVDARMLMTERRDLMTAVPWAWDIGAKPYDFHVPPRPPSFDDMKDSFLAQFHQLYGRSE